MPDRQPSRFGPMLALVVAGCAAVYAGRGVEAQVEAPVDTVVQATYAVFKEMGIAITDTDFDEEDAEYDIEGRRGEAKVDVSVERKSPRFTVVEVSVDHDDEEETLAREILNRIVKRVS